MKIVKILLLLLLIAKIGMADELIVDFEQDSVPVLNEELRRLNNIGEKNRKLVVWYVMGGLSTGTDVGARITLPFSATITKASAYIKTAPTGASVIVDINKNGSTIWSTQANRLTVVATENIASQSTFNTTDLSADDYLSLDIDQVGATISGSSLTVELELKI